MTLRKPKIPVLCASCTHIKETEYSCANPPRGCFVDVKWEVFLAMSEAVLDWLLRKRFSSLNQKHLRFLNFSMSFFWHCDWNHKIVLPVVSFAWIAVPVDWQQVFKPVFTWKPKSLRGKVILTEESEFRALISEGRGVHFTSSRPGRVPNNLVLYIKSEFGLSLWDRSSKLHSFGTECSCARWVISTCSCSSCSWG